MEEVGNRDVYYSLDKPSSQVKVLPRDCKCKLCQCVPQVHVMYFKCPLMQDFICTSCCIEEVTQETNLSNIQAHTTISSFPEVVDICKNCGNNSFQK